MVENWKRVERILDLINFPMGADYLDIIDCAADEIERLLKCLESTREFLEYIELVGEWGGIHEKIEAIDNVLNKNNQDDKS